MKPKLKNYLPKTLLISLLPILGSTSKAIDFDAFSTQASQPIQESGQESAQSYDSELLEVQVRDTRGIANTDSVSFTSKMTKSQIQASGARNLDQLLVQFAGIQLSRTGGPGGQSSFFVRGTEADSLLVLVNDVKIQSINTGSSAFNNIPLDTVESVEIIRGGQSALYGSATPGGIIKINTIPQKQRNTLRLDHSSSNESDAITSLGAGAPFGNAFVFGNGNWVVSDGIDACNNSSACFTSTPELDQDGLEQLNGQVGFSYTSDLGQSIEISKLYNEARQEFDGDFSNKADATQSVTNAKLATAFGQRHSLRFQAGEFIEQYDTFLNTQTSETPIDTFETHRNSASLVHEATFEAISLISGVDYDHSTLKNSTIFPKINRTTNAFFSELQFQKANTTVRIGGRRDQYKEQRETAVLQKQYVTTGHAKFKIQLAQNWALKTSISKNFNLPNFQDLYFPGFESPDLKPENHLAQEIGFEYIDGGSRSSLVAFRSKTTDFIAFNGTGLENIAKVNINGLEISHQYQSSSFGYGANITLLDATNKSNNTQLARRPKAQFSGHLSYSSGHTTTRIGTLVSGKRFDDLANTRQVGGFSLFDFGITQKATPNLTLGARVDNMFDKDYETVFGYNQPGRVIWLEIGYQIQ